MSPYVSVIHKDKISTFNAERENERPQFKMRNQFLSSPLATIAGAEIFWFLYHFQTLSAPSNYCFSV